MSLAAGTRIGKYTVNRELGHGGFGVIYVARDSGLDRDVALKVLRREHVARGDLVQRFLQEARAAAKIDHPGIVTVFECGVVDDARLPEAGTVYIAMELLRGETLARRIKRGRLPMAMALGICQQAAAALGAAHRAGIVHRDLKPENLMLCPDRAVLGGERVKLLDFGIAKLAESAWQPEIKTHSMMVMGTPQYMSPEQCKSSAKVDARSDIYTLGCIVYELVCGRPPYDGDSGELIAKHQLAAVPEPRLLAPDLPASLDLLLRAMLAKQPEDRPQNMEQVEARLEACIAHGDDAPTGMMLARPPTLPAVVSPNAPTAMAGTLEQRPARAGWSGRLLVSGAVAAVALGVGVAVMASGGHAAVTPADAARAAVIVPPPPPAVDAAIAVVVAVVAPVDAADVMKTPDAAAAEIEVAPDAAAPVPPPAHSAHKKVPSAHEAEPAPEPAAPTGPCNVDEHARLANKASTQGSHAQALAEYEAALRCHPDAHLLGLAYMEACGAGQAAKAKAYFARMPATGSYSQQTLLQMCMRVGIDPRANPPR